jgi:hypothetical protein
MSRWVSLYHALRKETWVKASRNRRTSHCPKNVGRSSFRAMSLVIIRSFIAFDVRVEAFWGVLVHRGPVREAPADSWSVPSNLNG